MAKHFYCFSNCFVITTHKMILLPYLFCDDSPHAYASPFALCIQPFAPSKP